MGADRYLTNSDGRCRAETERNRQHDHAFDDSRQRDAKQGILSPDHEYKRRLSTSYFIQSLFLLLSGRIPKSLTPACGRADSYVVLLIWMRWWPRASAN